MFIGHYGAGFAARKINFTETESYAKPSLGTYFLAAQFLDILWPVFIALGLEKVSLDQSGKPFQTLHFNYYPFSHSLLATIIWAALFGLVYFVFRKNVKYSILLALVAISHWVLDLISHFPDLQLSPGISFKVGFGLWNSLALTIIVEGLIFVIGAYLYIASTKAKNKRGYIVLWTLLFFLSLTYVMDIIGPPPPSITALTISGFSQWLIIAWGYWIDRNRLDEI
jgi:hypothetical protein